MIMQTESAGVAYILLTLLFSYCALQVHLTNTLLHYITFHGICAEERMKSLTCMISPSGMVRFHSLALSHDPKCIQVSLLHTEKKKLG